MTTTHPDEQMTTVAAFTHGPETLENTLHHASSRSVLGITVRIALGLGARPLGTALAAAPRETRGVLAVAI